MENPSLFKRILQTLGLASLLLKSEGKKSTSNNQKQSKQKNEKAKNPSHKA